MFNYPATELFKDGVRRVVWSLEEYEAALIENYELTQEPAPELPAPKAPKAKK